MHSSGIIQRVECKKKGTMCRELQGVNRCVANCKVSIKKSDQKLGDFGGRSLNPFA